MSDSANLFRKAKIKAEEGWRQPLKERQIQLVAMAEAALAAEFEVPQLEFSQRGTIAGSARLQANLIRLNPVLLCDQPESFIAQILPHELAHLLVHQHYGRVAPHGTQWQHLMSRIFGLPPHRTHQLDVSKVRGQCFAYACGCQTHELTIRRHNKILRGTSYKCRACGQLLVASA